MIVKRRVKPEIWKLILESGSRGIEVPYSIIDKNGREHNFSITYARHMFPEGDIVSVVEMEADTEFAPDYRHLLPERKWTIMGEHLEEIVPIVEFPKNLFQIED